MDDRTTGDFPAEPILRRGGPLEAFIVAAAFALPGPGQGFEPLWKASRHVDNLMALAPQAALLLYIIGSGAGFGAYFRLKPKLSDLFGAVMSAGACVGASICVSWLSGALGMPSAPGTGTADLPAVLFLPLVALSAAAVGLREELLYRVYFITTLRRSGVPVIVAAAASTVLFAAGHAYLGLPGVASAAVLGAILAAFYLRSASLWVVAGGHALYDFIAMASAARFWAP